MRDLILQAMRQLGELVDIAVDAAHEAIQLGEHFRDVGGNFRERAREDAEVVVAIHLQLAELRVASVRSAVVVAAVAGISEA